MDEHLFLVTYDIADPKRLRRVFKLMKGYGEWTQLSVFQCRLTSKRRAEMHATLDEMISQKEDHVLIFDLGVADKVEMKVTSLGKTFEAVAREPTII